MLAPIDSSGVHSTLNQSFGQGLVKGSKDMIHDSLSDSGISKHSDRFVLPGTVTAFASCEQVTLMIGALLTPGNVVFQGDFMRGGIVQAFGTVETGELVPHVYC